MVWRKQKRATTSEPWPQPKRQRPLRIRPSHMPASPSLKTLLQIKLLR